MSYGQIKALATGDPAFLEVAELEDTTARLTRLERAHSQDQAAVYRRRDRLVHDQDRIGATLGALRPLAARVTAADQEWAGHGSRPWQVEISGYLYDNRGDAARALDANLPRYQTSRPLRFPAADIEFAWQPDGYQDPGRLQLVTGDRDPGRAIDLVIDDRTQPGLMGALTRATNLVADLPAKIKRLEHELVRVESQLALAAAAAGTPFAGRDELVAARRRLAHLSAELADRYAPIAEPGNGGRQVDPAPQVGPAGITKDQSSAVFPPGAGPTSGQVHPPPSHSHGLER